MEESTVEREYPYRHSVMQAGFIFLLFGSFAVFGLWMAMTEKRNIIINGIIPLRGEAAVIFRWVIFAGVAVLFFMSCKVLWNRMTNPNQRIAFTASGLLLPRNSWSAKDVFVHYSQIRDVAFASGEPFAVFKSDGVKIVTAVLFACPQGNFSIARNMLRKGDFEELCELLLRKVEEANSLTRRRD